MIETITEFCKANVDVIAAVGVLIAAVLFIKNEFFGLFSKKPKLELSADAAQAIVGAGTPSVDEPHVIEFLRIRKAMKADLEEEFKDAAEKDKVLLLARIAELERQISNPEPALAEAQKRIADLEALLDRESNEFGAERIAAAKTALEAGDYSLADDIFAELEAREELAVQRAARAAFGRGEVAEAEIRWHDAYTHFKRAKDLHETEAHLESYARMTWRLAKGAEAVLAYEQLVAVTKATYGDDSSEYAIQLNNLAEVLRAKGDLPEAEKLFREALAIDAATIGTAHPDYAIDLNNLAGVLYEQQQTAQAREMLQQALDILTAALPADHPNIANVKNALKQTAPD